MIQPAPFFGSIFLDQLLGNHAIEGRRTSDNYLIIDVNIISSHCIFNGSDGSKALVIYRSLNRVPDV